MEKKVLVSNILWETDENEYGNDLPTELELEMEFPEEYAEDEQMITEYIADFLSNEYEFLVNSFSID